MPAVLAAGRVIIYLAAMVWMYWFTRSVSRRVRRAAILFYIGLGIELAAAMADGVGVRGYTLTNRPHGPGLLAISGTCLALGSVFIIMLEMSRASQRHKREAEVDHLTGLFNRRVFFARAGEALSDACAGRCRPAIALLDVDNMKEINDMYGHQCGDEVLRRAARALRLSVRHDDVPARYGGDEFAVLFADSGPALETLKERMQQYLAPGEPRCGASINVSMGIARYPTDGKDVDALLRAADSMMYAEKSRRRGARHRPVGEPVRESGFFPS